MRQGVVRGVGKAPGNIGILEGQPAQWTAQVQVGSVKESERSQWLGKADLSRV
jgi:hypothetical protein